MAPRRQSAGVFFIMRVICLIDGFNIYHALDDEPCLHKYKWLNYRRLCNCFALQEDKVGRILFFTALPPWDRAKQARHEKYIRALKSVGIESVLGEFRKVTATCRADCRKEYHTHREKQTDVNIAVALFELAMNDEYDKAFILSGDSDFLPAIRFVHRHYPKKEIFMIVPPGRRTEELEGVVDGHHRITESHLRASVFDSTITVDHNVQLTCPPSWC